MAASGNGRNMSTDSNKVDEPLKVEEAETVNVPPPLTEKVLHFEAVVYYEFCKPLVMLYGFLCSLDFAFYAF
jgi:hypothetical protein